MIEHALNFLAAEQFGGVRLDQVGELRRHHRAGIHHGVPEQLRLLAVFCADPGGGQAKTWVGGGHAGDRSQDFAGIDREKLANLRLACTHFHALEQDAVAVGFQLQVVANVHRRNQKADLAGELFAQRADAFEQFAVLIAVDHRNQAIAHFQCQNIHRRDVVPTHLRRFQCRCCGRFGGFVDGWWPRFDRPCQAGQQARHQQEHGVGHARDQTQPGEDASGGVEHSWALEHLTDHLFAEVLVGAHPRHHDAGRGADDQRRDLRHQAVADGQQGVVLRRLRKRQVVLQHADKQPTDNVDNHDQDAGHCVATHELAGTVHRAEEVRFLRDLLPPLAGLGLADHAAVEVGVDRHLLAGHRVQREACTYFGDPACALGDHHKIDDDQDDEDDDADRIVAANHKVAERFDHFACRIGASVTGDQDHPGRCDVERQAQQCGEQQEGGEHRKIQRLAGVERHQQDDHRQRDIEGEQHVQRHRRQRQHHHRQDQDDQQRQSQASVHAAASVSRASGSRSAGTRKSVGRTAETGSFSNW